MLTSQPATTVHSQPPPVVNTVITEGELLLGCAVKWPDRFFSVMALIINTYSKMDLISSHIEHSSHQEVVVFNI